MTITLATLKDATAQQVFDQVAAHLLKQNARSRSEEAQKCMYRGDGGMMCAAGCLIADDEYKPEMDKGRIYGGGTWNNMVMSGLVPNHHRDLIIDLQHVHDCGGPDRFVNELRRTADNHNLEFNHAG